MNNKRFFLTMSFVQKSAQSKGPVQGLRRFDCPAVQIASALGVLVCAQLSFANRRIVGAVVLLMTSVLSNCVLNSCTPEPSLSGKPRAWPYSRHPEASFLLLYASV